MREPFSAENERILEERRQAFDLFNMPRVGDYVTFPDGHEERISHDWTEDVQTSSGGSWYLGKGYASFSGGLNAAIPVARLELTDEKRGGRFWFFDRDWWRASAAVYVTIPCRVYRLAAV